MKLGEQIEQFGLNRMNFAVAEIAEDEIHLAQRVGQILAVRPIFHLGVFAGVQVVECQSTRRPVRSNLRPPDPQGLSP